MIFDLENCNDSSENCLQPEQQQQPEQSNDEQLHCLPGTSSSCTPSSSRTIESRRQSRTNLSTAINNNNLQSTAPIISATSQKRFELFDRIKQFYSILLMMAILLTLIRLTTWIGTTTSTDHRHNYYQQYLNSIKFNKNLTTTTTTNQLELSTIKHQQQRINDDDRNKTEQQQQQQENDKLEIVLQRQIIQQTKIIDCATFFLYLMSLYGVYNENYTLSSTTTISMIFMLGMFRFFSKILLFK